MSARFCCFFLLLALSSAGLGACGIKGPLYLPEEEDSENASGSGSENPVSEFVYSVERAL